MTAAEFLELAEAAARNLTGTPLTVQFGGTEGNAGLTYLDGNRQVVIALSPALTAKQLVLVFLHECGHALHHQFLLVQPKVLTAGYARGPLENEADRQANDWLEMADGTVQEYLAHKGVQHLTEDEWTRLILNYLSNLA